MTRAVCALVLIALGGCADLTEIVVVADTDLRVPQDIDEIAFTVDASAIDMRMSSVGSSVDPAVHRPAVLGIIHEDGALGPMTIVAIGRHDGKLVVTREAIVSFEHGRVRMLRMDLFSECEDAECHDPGTTCGTVDGRCVELAQPLEEW